jgi:hypothetical protein
MGWALDVFSWLAPDILAELLVTLGGVAAMAFFKKRPGFPPQRLRCAVSYEMYTRSFAG